MTSYAPIVKNGANGAIFYVSLAPRTANGQWQANPTLASGDVKISLDGGALANLNTLPAVTPASSKLVKVTLSQAETNADNIAILFSDAADAEWCDLTINLQTAARQFDDLAIQSDLTAVKGKTDSLNFTVSGQVDANVTNWKGSAAAAMTGDAYARLGAPAGASISADVAAIAAKTNNLPSDPADASDVAAAITAVQNHGDTYWLTASGFATASALSSLSDGISASFTALQSHGDGAWATASGFSTLVAADVKTQADQALADAGVSLTVTGRLDAAISSRLAADSYTVPDNAGIASIAAKTGNLPDDPADQSLIIDATNGILGRLGAPAGASVSADIASVKGDTAAVRGKTDQMAFTGEALDANIAKVNGAAVTGNGTGGNEWGPA